jgi:hypothetical protein
MPSSARAAAPKRQAKIAEAGIIRARMAISFCEARIVELKPWRFSIPSALRKGRIVRAEAGRMEAKARAAPKFRQGAR